MKVKNLTPFPFAPKLTARKPPQREMAVIVRGAFALRPGQPLEPFPTLSKQGPMKGEEFLPDDDDRTGEAVYPGDFADFKLNAEVLLLGACHAPGGRPVKECPVRFAVGAWSKSLRVLGRRFWSDGMLQAGTEPQPFTRMPLRYENAFGGPGHARNPVGKGIGTLEMPSVEAKEAPVRSRSDRPEPAGYGPLSSLWPDRAARIGKEYGSSWKKTRAPFYAEDFDWRYFHSAPADQQLEGYLRGDEEVVLQNLHPEAPLLSVRLPGLRIRAFVKDDRGDLREVRMSLDTLCAVPDEGRLLLTWRGLGPVREDDLKDVAFMLLASEPLSDRPLPEAHYRAILEAFAKDPLETEAHIQKHVPPHLQDAARKVLRGESLAIAPPPEGTPPAQAITQMVKQIPGVGGRDLSAVERGIEQGAAGAAPHADVNAALQSALAGAGRAGGGGSISLVPGATPRVPLADALAQLREKIANVEKLVGANSVEHDGLGKADEILADPRLKLLDPSVAPPGEPQPPPPEPGPFVDCSGRDLRDRDLSGRDLSGANFEGALLSRAKLHRAKLAGANLRGAVLENADLEGASFEGADLTRANLTGAGARGASFAGATLDRAFFGKACLAGAVLDGARAETIFLNGTDLAGARARGVRLHKALARGAVLTEADFSGAELHECYFLKCRADGMIARNAAIGRSSFAGSDLGRAIFAGARGERTIWLGAKIGRADFSYAVLPWAHFDEATGSAALFFGTNLKGASFYRAALEHAQMEKANLFGASFCKATLTGTRFTDANLFDARFLGSSGADVSFVGANLKRAQFERA
jgi:uncharacterized protein YjbI with pentapeptide repeats